MISGSYLRQQAEILTAISRTTFDLGVARRLREMASELETRAAEDDAGRTSNNFEIANSKLQTQS